MSKNLLLIGFLYYPSASVGARRLVNFKKHLTKFGYEVTVLTVNAMVYSDVDTTLESADLEVGVVRTKSFGPIRVPPRKASETAWYTLRRRIRYVLYWLANLLLVPDVHIGWAPHAWRAAKRLAGERRFEAVISTAQPWADLLIGDRIASSLGVPHIVDYRDPWTAYERTIYRNALMKRLSRRLEQGILLRAKHVLLNTESVRCMYLRTFPELAADKFHVVRNGFDQDVEDSLRAVAGRASDGGVFSLMHSGNFYGSRNIGDLCRAIAILRDDAVVSPLNFKLITRRSRQPAQDGGLPTSRCGPGRRAWPQWRCCCPGQSDCRRTPTLPATATAPPAW